MRLVKLTEIAEIKHFTHLLDPPYDTEFSTYCANYIL